MKEEFFYDAFISYKHTKLDQSVAEKLHKMLENYKVPKVVSKKYGKKKITRVFRDKDELPIATDLAENINEALRKSEYLIVICSRESVCSEWVRKEIMNFIKFRGRQNILAVLIDGEPSDSFPDELLYDNRVVVKEDGTKEVVTVNIEPLAADIRGSSEKEVIKKLKDELNRIVAPLLYCTYDDLQQRHKEMRQRKVRRVFILIFIVLLMFGSFSTYQYYRIQQNLQDKLETQSRYLAQVSGQLLEEGDRMKAIQVALEALPTKEHKRPYVVHAENALINALKVYEAGDSFSIDRAVTHDATVVNVKLSPTGTRISSVDSDDYFYIWNVEQGELLYKSPEPWPGITKDKMQFIDDEKIIVNTDASLFCMNTQSGEMLWENKNKIWEIKLSHDKSLCVAYSTKLYILDTSNGKVKFEKEGTNLYDTFDSAIISHDNELLAIGMSNYDKQTYTIEVLDLNRKKELYVIKKEKYVFPKIMFTSNGNLLVAINKDVEDVSNFLYGNGDACLTLFDQKGKVIWNKESLSTYLNKMDTVYFDNTEYVVYSGGNRLCTIDISTGKEKSCVLKSSDIINYVLFDDSDFSFTATRDGNINIDLLSIGGQYDRDNIKYNGTICDFDFVRGHMVIVPESSNQLVLYKIMKGSKYNKIVEYNTNISDGTYNKSGDKVLVYSNFGQCLTVIDQKTKKECYNRTFNNGIVEATFVEDNKLYVMNTEGIAYLINLNTKEEKTKTLVMDAGTYTTEEEYVVFQNDDKINIFNKKNFEMKEINYSDSINHISLNETKKQLYILGYNEYKIMDFNGKILYQEDKVYRKIVCDKQGIYYALLSPDNSLVIKGVEDDKIISTIKVSSNNVSEIIFDENEARIFINFMNKTIKVYDCSTGELLQNLQKDIYDLTTAKTMDEGKYLLLKGSAESYLYLNDTYEVFANIKGFLDVSPSMDEFLVGNSFEAGTVPFYSLDMLLEEGRQQINQQELTQEEKVDLYID